MGSLTDKVAIVTGGSGGIGSAICERLAIEGAKVVVHYGGHANSANEIVKKIKTNGGEAVAIQANLSNGDEVTKLFEEAQQQFGTPDILINNAGTGEGGPVAKMDEAAFDKVFGLNAKGTFLCMKEAANRLNNNGRIVNISSGLVVRPMPGFSLYCGSKVAIELIGKVLSMELGDRGITVNTVSPGPTETEMFANSGDDAKAAAERSPFNRLGEPEDIADVIAFVVSEKCRWITGHTFQVGGGYV
ncbi:SDR family oxidoreductase [Komarekiella sp. 'clone 1']|uniref:SDR family oxidoreductase n=1 Tax=Komarekiella delphini-convector SJRDD-AB1 TaxID=2593771 RepID=A0AA40T591_9NOST|nr:SDR family oxidoreductase [Komarekiella delphini-convector]MBD6620889.1 SDR family oxidoreductase [Komarekiella delphini-convector SJRDD-AB1]